MLKKLSFGGYLCALAAILGLVGAILTIVSGTVSADNPLANAAMITAAAFAGAVLSALPIFTSTRFGNFDLIGSVSIIAAIALYCYAFGAAVSQRVMLVAGLFSFNAGNTAGWNVFYVSVGAWACLLVGCLVLIISGFLRSAKENA